MDFQLEDKKDLEIEKLIYYYKICKNALYEFSNNHPYQLAEYENEKINIVLKRLFNNEIDYLKK
jgi:hypothetical protein